MIDDLEIRESTQDDIPALERLYPAAFPDEDLLPVLSELLDDQPWGVSLVATFEGAVVGHIYFTDCTVTANTGTGNTSAGITRNVSMLAPLAVAPALQRQGIGGALIRAGIARVKNADALAVCVLGDPAYYDRFGFEREDDILTPYPLPEEWRGAWQSIWLQETGEHLKGTLSVPAPWRKPELWSE